MNSLSQVTVRNQTPRGRIKTHGHRWGRVSGGCRRRFCIRCHLFRALFCRFGRDTRTISLLPMVRVSSPNLQKSARNKQPKIRVCTKQKQEQTNAPEIGANAMAVVLVLEFGRTVLQDVLSWVDHGVVSQRLRLHRVVIVQHREVCAFFSSPSADGV